MEQYLECGKVLNTHGVKGAVKIESWCDSPAVLCELPRMYYERVKNRFIELEVEKASIHKGCALVYFKGINTIEDAMPLKNRVLLADRKDMKLGADRVFIADIIGRDVFDESTNKRLGVLTDFIENAYQALFCVTTENGDVLIPDVDEFIGHIDESGVYLRPIPGMFDEPEVVEPDDEVLTRGDEDEI